MQRFAPSFETFVRPARARAELWRTFAGLCLVAAIYVGLSFIAFEAYDRLFQEPDTLDLTPRLIVFFLFGFAFMGLGTALTVRLLHGRGFGTLFGRPARVIEDFVKATAIAGLVFAGSIGLYSLWFDLTPGVRPSAWLFLLPLCLIGLVIQTGAEEVLFRGYLQQQLAARFASPLAWAIAPSLLFGFAHYSGEGLGDNAMLVVVVTGTFGLVAADLTARTGSIGAAWGFHFVNNIYAFLIISLDGELSGLALYKTPFGADDATLKWLVPFDILLTLTAWLLLRRLLSR